MEDLKADNLGGFKFCFEQENEEKTVKKSIKVEQSKDF